MCMGVQYTMYIGSRNCLIGGVIIGVFPCFIGFNGESEAV